MSDPSTKGNQTVSQKDKDGTEKRGRGRPRKLPKEPSGSPTPKRPRGRPKGSKNKVTSKSKIHPLIVPAFGGNHGNSGYSPSHPLLLMLCPGLGVSANDIRSNAWPSLLPAVTKPKPDCVVTPCVQAEKEEQGAKESSEEEEEDEDHWTLTPNLPPPHPPPKSHFHTPSTSNMIREGGIFAAAVQILASVLLMGSPSWLGPQ
ncbi:hypothetical protein JZ751_017395 [Albula glossodonta]|uniref:High mobility group protein HMG-I/HMG-Y n=1 Tax=Albula glossodonta TaxID=121402 RepID=A0A8T2PKG5_9TELE|nr:hypothetical protein JZ751_017395 [Albula glossodonta]